MLQFDDDLPELGSDLDFAPLEPILQVDRVGVGSSGDDPVADLEGTRTPPSHPGYTVSDPAAAHSPILSR